MMDGLLSIKKEDKIEKIPVGKIEKLFITKSVFMTSDVMYACIENGIDLLITERNGQPIGRLWNNKFGSISSLRKKQLVFCKSIQANSWVVNQIKKKTDHQIELLFCLLSLDGPKTSLIHQRVEKMKRIASGLEKFKSGKLLDLAPAIRATEGQIARIYFECVGKHLPFIYRFKKRSRNPAKDMTNAMLNYTYGILYGHIESGLIKAGLDPFIGIFHRDEYNRPVLTYDVIEVFRPWADWVVFHLCFNEVIDDTMFNIENGVYWLHGDSKRVLIQHFTDFFEEVVSFRGKKYSRFTHIDRLASSLASKIGNVEAG